MIKEFQGEYRWLSNFWPARIALDARVYPSVENAYQAAKYPAAERKPFETCSAAEAKRRGKGMKLSYRIEIMYGLVKQKFTIPALRTKLLATDEEVLEEGNLWHDSFWGTDLRTGLGENNLGKIIMQVRKELQMASSWIRST